MQSTYRHETERERERKQGQRWINTTNKRAPFEHWASHDELEKGWDRSLVELTTTSSSSRWIVYQCRIVHLLVIRKDKETSSKPVDTPNNFVVHWWTIIDVNLTTRVNKQIVVRQILIMDIFFLLTNVYLWIDVFDMNDCRASRSIVTTSEQS
jgi:hypothetical protein